MRGEVYVPPGGPPEQGPSRLIYERLGQANIFRMMKDFYVELEKSEVRHLFPDDMVLASQRSAAFFVGLLGGPPLYQERYGNPMMRARHLPFAIDERARQIWLECFRRTLDGAEFKYGFPPEHLPGFLRFLDEFSAWMVNTRTVDEDTSEC